MTRSSFRPMAAVGLVAAVLSYVGCTRTYDTTGPVTDPKPLPATAKVEKTSNVISDWSAAPPAAVLVISGEQHGYLQPCGCTDGQLGGLGRRYDFIEKLRARGWPVAPIDLGDLLYQPATSRGGMEQEKIKFGIALDALAAMKYAAVALGPEDLKIGVGETMAVLLNHEQPRFLSANVTPALAELEKTIQPFTIIQAGPVRIGVTAVVDPVAFEALADVDKATYLNVKPPDEVLPAILADLEKRAKVRVLMVQGTIEEGKRLAAKFPSFDLVITRSKFPDPDERPESLNGGKTLLINVGMKGKYAGVVGFFPDSSPMIRYRRQALDGRDFREAEPMRALIDDDMQRILKSAGVVENFPRKDNGAALPGATYVGAQTCQTCHPKTFEKWTTTKHARAYDALTNPKRNREFDAECISCHATGFGFNSGWVSAEKTPNLKGNQCENCHGPASLHIAEPDNLAYRKPMAMSAERANKDNFCIKCHDEDNDHNFKFESRYAQIFHKGLDSYDDPKVHQPAKVAEGR